MKQLYFLVFILISFSVEARSLCEKMQSLELSNSNSQPVTFSKEQWRSLDVLVDFDYELCKESVSLSSITIEGMNFDVVRTTEDRCDGGNTYGAIFTKGLSTPVAHIYDGDIYCSEDWSDSYKVENHKCDSVAEQVAEEKMNSFGLPFESQSSSLELRSPYAYSFIHVHGKLLNRLNQSATVLVMMNLKSCAIGGVSIENLEL